MAEFEIPKRIALDDLKDLLKGYYLEGAHNDPVSTSAIKDTTQLGDRVGRQTDFLVSVGLLEKEGRKRKLTESGGEIAEALMGGSEEIARARMRDVVTDWEFTNKIQGFLRMQGPVSDKQLTEFITANVNSDDDRGKKTLIDLLVWAKVIEQDEEGYVVSEGKLSTEQIDDNGDSEQEIAEEPTSEGVLTKTSDNLTVHFEFEASDNPEDITKVILAARRGLMTDIDLNGLELKNDTSS